MSEYFEVYRQRATHLGVTPQERAFKSGQLEFKKNLHYNQSTVRGLRCEDSYFDGVILTDKQDENRISQILLTELSVELKPGDLVVWNEKPWLIYKKVVSAYQPHNKFYMVQCNYVINWVDTKGNLHSSAAYIVGTKDSKLKGNYRTWNELITPQPNKFMEVLMPYQPIEKSTEIILYDEAWELIEYDRVSVPGTIYLSFTESKVNELRDSVQEQIANIDKLQVWSINAPLQLSVEVGEIINPIYTLLKNGVIQKDLKATLVPSEKMSYNENGELIATETGETELLLTYENLMLTLKVIIGGAAPIGYINGDNFIRMGRSASYELVMPDIGAVETEFVIDNTVLASIQNQGNKCIVKANERNKLGKVILSTEYNGQSYTKSIDIYALWQEA